jgi:DHA2 family methylenomycin A resistance protein-like MFS transporter
VFAGNLLAERFVAAIGARRVLVGAAAATAASLAGLLVVDAQTAFVEVVAQLVALGFGLGVIVPTITAAQLGSVDAGRAGIASGTLNTARQTGSVVGVAVFGSLAASALVSGLRIAVLISVVLALAVLLLGRALDG